MINFNNEKFKRALKYVIMWFSLIMTVKFISSQEINKSEVAIIAMIGSVIFAILDMYAPSISDSVRTNPGSTFGIKTLTL